MRDVMNGKIEFDKGLLKKLKNSQSEEETREILDLLFKNAWKKYGSKIEFYDPKPLPDHEKLPRTIESPQTHKDLKRYTFHTNF